MRRYIGTKIVLAKPMTRETYCVLRGWKLPYDENGADEGYLVEYEPDGKSNVEGHAGYVTWSPKDVFEAAYQHRPLAEGLLPHQQRVADEYAELSTKLLKLSAFTATDLFKAQPEDERRRLIAQLSIMDSYCTILTERIAAFR